jgi:DNA-directed RNA polymerase specialized sigma24 family protein
MRTNSGVSYTDTLDVNEDNTWGTVYPRLRPFVRYLVNSFKVPSWYGQEEDIVEDIVQETTRRLIERARKAQNGEAATIRSLQHMMVTIAYNYYRDLKRRDRRLFRVPAYSSLCQVYDRSAESHLLEVVVDKVYQERLFTLIAREVQYFPDKQREALLIDLANRMSFDTHPTPLQAAFLKVGIELRQYQQPLPTDLKERSRHVSLLTHAYKRIARLPCVQRYI